MLARAVAVERKESKTVKLVHKHMRTHAHTLICTHTRGRYVWSVTVKCLECVL